MRSWMVVALVLSGCATSGPPIAREPGMRTAVILLDLQRDFLEADGRMPVAADQVEPLLASAAELSREARSRGLPVVAVHNEFSPWDVPANWFRGGAAVRGSPGSAGDPRAPSGDVLFTKSAPDAFSSADLDAWLREQRVDHVVIAGLFADQCVTYTAQGALNRGYRVTVVREGVAAAGASDRDGALEDLAERGARVASAASAVAWSPTAEGP